MINKMNIFEKLRFNEFDYRCLTEEEIDIFTSYNKDKKSKFFEYFIPYTMAKVIKDLDMTVEEFKEIINEMYSDDYMSN